MDEQQAWFLTVMSSTFFLPHCAIITAATMPFGAEHWCSAFMPTVEEGRVVLYFEDERLARWEVIEPVPVVSSGSTWDTDERQWDWDKDTAHYKAEKKALKKHQKKEKKLLTEHQKEEGTSKAHSKAEKKALKKHHKKENKALKKHEKKERRRLEKHQQSP